MADPVSSNERPPSRLKRILNRVKTSVRNKFSSAKRTPNPEQRQEPVTTQQQSSTTPAIAASKPVDASESTGPPQTSAQNAFAEQAQEAKPATDAGGRLIFRTTLDKEKVQALFAKYGLEFDGESVVISQISQEGERVQKPIRMRVRRQCHHCQTSFTRNLLCNQCGHRYCRECQRYPPKKPKSKDKGPLKSAEKGEKDVVEEVVEPPAAPVAAQ